jgi:cytochrome d ubiquinol oxidase subunit II
VLIPFFFGAAIGGVASGRVPVGNAAGDLIDSWLNPTSIAIGIVAILTGAHLAAVFLTGDAKRAELPDMVAAFRTRAVFSGVAAGAAAVVTLVVVRSDARTLYDGLTSGDGLIAVLVSALAGVATIALVAGGRFGPARFAAAAAVGAMTIGWALAQDPYILPGQLTLDEAAASNATLVALVVSVGLGMLVLIPSLVWLYRLVLRGTLDQDYEPLDQRFNPVDS